MSVKDKEIWNCSDLFSFQCPKRWENLEKTNQPDLKYCQVCKEHVYYCESPDEFVRRGELGECVAIPDVNTIEVASQLWVGRPSQEKTAQRDSAIEYWQKVLEKNPQFLKSHLTKLAGVSRIMRAWIGSTN